MEPPKIEAYRTTERDLDADSSGGRQTLVNEIGRGGLELLSQLEAETDDGTSCAI